MKALLSMNPAFIFLFSALAFILANNWHFAFSGSLFPILLDWVGIALFILGVVVLIRKGAK